MVFNHAPEPETTTDIIATAATADRMYETYTKNWPKVLAFNAKMEGIRLSVLNTCTDVIAKARKAYEYTHCEYLVEISDAINNSFEDIHKMFLNSQEALTMKASLGDGLDEVLKSFEQDFIDMYSLQLDAAEGLVALTTKTLNLYLEEPDSE